MYGFLNLKYNYYERKLSYTEVVNNLKKNRPMQLRLSRYINGTNEGAHAIALCGTFLSLIDNHYYYVYRDPNVSGFVVNSIIESTRLTSSGTTFYYNNGVGNRYNNWYGTFVVYK